MEMTQMENHDPDDPVAVYVLETCKVEPLTKIEETKLFQELGHSGIGTNRGKMSRGD
jgi:hypothetical protein